MIDYTDLEDGSLGKYIRQVRQRKGLSVKELSIITGIPKISIYACELNKYTPTAYNLAVICDALDIPFSTISDIILKKIDPMED